MSPTKLELLAAWLPAQPWFTGDAGSLVKAGGFRLDDPAGEVGIEVLLLADAAGLVHHVPLTYRGAPVDGVPLVGTSQHGVLGWRWIHDAVQDPVAVAQLEAFARGEVRAQQASVSDAVDDTVRVEWLGAAPDGVAVEVLRRIDVDGGPEGAPSGAPGFVTAPVRVADGERRCRIAALTGR